jgi:peptide/nickel transport system substrate-binding protein
MKMIGTAAAVCVAATVVAACGSDKGHQPTGTGGGKAVSGGTFNFAMSADPGKLDPQASAANVVIQISQFAYDYLINTNAAGKLVSGLATSWKTTGTSVALTLKKGITCSDGTTFSAADAAANVNYVADPKNKSPLLGVYVPVGAKATADTGAGTVTVTTPKLAPFVLNGLANLPMVCAKGIKDRKMLATGTDGTGPFKLTQAVSGDHYTYTKRAGYTWGPDGASTATKGVPDKVVIKIVQNETTAANLLLSGGLNAAIVSGADSTRLAKAKLFAADSSTVFGEMWFNQAKGRPTVDKSVRLALTEAVDLTQLQKVVTSGQGTGPTVFAASPPSACPGNSIASMLPKHDVDAAGKLLDSAGWKMGSGGVRSKGGKQLALTFVYGTPMGPGGAAGAELATQVWRKLGVKITLKAQDDTELVKNIFGAGDWDIGWISLNVSSPDQLVPFLSGPAPSAGSNFAHLQNAAYTAGVAKASTIPAPQGCADWLKAESSLVSDVDVIPFANKVVKIFGAKARFVNIGDLIPTSIRMQSS